MESSQHFHKELNKKFEDFAESLLPSEEGHNMELGMLERVRKHLQERLRQLKDPNLNEAFAQAVFYYGGNFQSTRYGVFDIIIKLPINGDLEMPEPLKMFETTLVANAKYLQIIPNSVSKTFEEESIQFSFANGTNVRILMVSEHSVPKEGDIYRKMRGSPKSWRYYTAVNVEMRMEFMATQDGVVRNIATLLKRWFLGADLGEMNQYVGDMCIILELVATHAALALKEKKNEWSVLGGFTKAIEYFCFVDKIRIAFDMEQEGTGEWRILPYVGLRHRPPFIENPTNSDNMLVVVNDSVRDMIQQVGFTTKARLLKIEEERALCETDESGTWNVKFDKLFESVKVQLELPPNWHKTSVACFVYLGVAKVVDSMTPFPSKDHIMVLEILRDRLQDLTRCLVAMNQNLHAARSVNHSQARSRLNKRVTETIKYAVKVALPGILVNGTNHSQLRIEWFDAAISIPYRAVDGTSVLMGFKWDAKCLPRFEEFCFY